jgi:tRNA threonylcarbamoyl adenosine modification protein YjeE
MASSTDNMIYISRSDKDTDIFSKNIISQFINLDGKPLIIFLEGEMGAGKTVLARSLISKLTDFERIQSPTYTIMNEYYKDDLKIVHLDLWRLNNKEDVLSLKLHKIIQENNIILIEWGSKFEDELNEIFNEEEIKIIKIEIEISKDSRKFYVKQI